MKRFLFIITLIIVFFDVKSQSHKEFLEDIRGIKESDSDEEFKDFARKYFTKNTKFYLLGITDAITFLNDNFSVRRNLETITILKKYSNDDKLCLKCNYKGIKEIIFLFLFNRSKVTIVTTLERQEEKRKLRIYENREAAYRKEIQQLKDNLSKKNNNSKIINKKLAKLYADQINNKICLNIEKIISNIKSTKIENEDILKIAEDSLKNILKELDKSEINKNRLANIIRMTDKHSPNITIYKKRKGGNYAGSVRSYSATYVNIRSFIKKKPHYKFDYYLYTLIDTTALKLTSDNDISKDEKNKLLHNKFFFKSIKLISSDIEKEKMPKINPKITNIGFPKSRYISDTIPLHLPTFFKNKERTLEATLPLIKDKDFDINCEIVINVSEKKILKYIGKKLNLNEEELNALDQGRYKINKIYIITNTNIKNEEKHDTNNY